MESRVPLSVYPCIEKSSAFRLSPFLFLPSYALPLVPVFLSLGFVVRHTLGWRWLLEASSIRITYWQFKGKESTSFPIASPKAPALSLMEVFYIVSLDRSLVVELDVLIWLA